jgi:hypothetical protein
MWFLLFLVLAVPSSNGQDQTRIVTYDDHAIVTPRRTERTYGKGEDRSTEVSIEPVVTGLRPPVLKRVQNALKMKSVLGSDIYKWFYKKQGMFGYEYRVTYNRNYILSIAFTYNAYFANHSRRLVFDLRDGHLIKLEELLVEERMQDLAKLVDQKLRAEIEEIVRDSDLKRAKLEAQGPLKVSAADLYEFGINEKGITLFYNAGFHHTAKDVEPEGRYFFKYSELKDYLKPGSIVSQFIK